jgi:membrane protease YdiL (CAAX protease family)
VIGAVLLVLAVANVVSNRVLPTWAYVPWNLAVAAAIVWIARRMVGWDDLGFREWRRGAAWGLVLLVLTTGVLLLALAMPAFNDMYHDRRVSGGTAEWLYQAFVRIPLGTAVLEETAFRAVLPALFAHRWGVLRGSVAASVCFGLWHVLPALSLNEVNPTATKVFGHGAGGVAVAVVFAVVGTAIAGLWWCWIRYRSRSVLATMIAHVASNSVAYTIAYAVGR